MSTADRSHYEDRLADALEQLLEAGADDLAALAAGLDRAGVTPPAGDRWSAELLASELARLGR